MDLAAQVLDRTSSLEVVLTHWAGVIEPTVAARQLAAIDAKSGGRLSLRMLSEPLNDDDAETRPVGHTVVWQRIDEYLVLLKRLWSNDRPFDHEGAFYSIKGGYMPRKGPHGADVDHPHGRPVRNGAEGRRPACRCLRTGAGLARRDPAADGTGAQRCRRTWPGRQAALRASGPDSLRGSHPPPATRRSSLSGPPAQVALSLLAYAALGIDEFMIVGVDRPREIATVGRETIALLRNSLARREARCLQPGAFAPRVGLETRAAG